MMFLNSQSRQLKYLDSLLCSGRIPHAFLFYGPEASDKKSAALAFVFRLNKPESSWPDFNDKDELARSIINGSHPDIFLVSRLDGKKDIGIAQIREFKNFVSRSPLNLAIKAAIVDGARYLNEESWNALLKTLEEPSRNTVIFLLSSTINDIPKTILSRVLPLYFASFEASSMAGSATAEDNLPKHDFASDDIIKKLVNLSSLSLIDRFELVEKILASDRPVDVLDAWALVLRVGLLNESRDNSTIAGIIKKIIETKQIISSTNANPRLALEDLMLRV